MKVRKLAAGTIAAAALSLGAAAPVAASHTPTHVQMGGAGGLVAAVVQAQVTDVEVVTVEVGDVNVALTNVLNNNRVLTNFLNENDVDIPLTDVVDVTLVGNTLIVNVLGTVI